MKYLDYNITDDATATGDNSYPNTTIIFKDADNDDYRLDPRADDEAVKSGVDLSADSYYNFDHDVAGNKIDDTWQIGAYHFTREIRVAVGSPVSTDLKTATSPLTASVDEGIMTFSEDQVDERLCAGCVVALSPIGTTTTAAPLIDEFLLYEKIDTKNWIVLKKYQTGSGEYEDIGKANFTQGDMTVDSIKPHDESLFSALYDNLSGEAGIVTENGDRINFKTSDIKASVYCLFGKDTVGAKVNDEMTFDETRNLTVKTPIDILKECNSNLRHNGVFDESKWWVESAGACLDGIQMPVDYMTVEGLQLNAVNYGIIITGKEFKASSNIVRNAGLDGIQVDSSNPSSCAAVVNNMIYDHVDNAIKIKHNDYVGNNSYINVYNNTMVGGKHGINVERRPDKTYTNVVRMRNNLVQDTSGRAYIINVYDPHTTPLESCWGGDTSLSRYEGRLNKHSVTVNFRDRYSKDYHLAFADSIAMKDAPSLSADPDYAFNLDYEGDDRAWRKWDIGADNFLIGADKKVNFSLGMYEGNLDETPQDRLVSISGSVLTFKGGAIGSRIGVGDKVLYTVQTTSTTTGTASPVLSACYLSEKGNSDTWIVRTYDGGLVDDTNGDAPVTSIKRVTHNINDALDVNGLEEIACEYSGKTTTTTTFLTSKDLVSAKASIFVWCYNDGGVDSTTADIKGWTCSDDYRLNILTPFSTITQCGKKQRASAKWDTEKYTISIVSGSPTDVILIEDKFVNVIGIQCLVYLNTIYGIRMNNTAGSNIILNNFIRNTLVGIEVESTITDCVVANNVIIGGQIGIRAYSGVAYNNTIAEFTQCGIKSNDPTTLKLRNNISVSHLSPTEGCYYLGSGADIEYCLSSDASATVNEGCVINVWIKFEDPTNYDYHLKRDDWYAINFGTDLSSDADFPFNYDIDMDMLDADSWSLGADSIPDLETLHLYFAIGKNTDNFYTGSATFSIIGGVAVFKEKQDNENFGIGQVITYDINKTCYLGHKISEDEWEVMDRNGLPPDDILNATVISVKNVFNEIATAIGIGTGSISELIGDSSTPFMSLKKAKYQINFPVYKNSTPHSEQIVVELYETDEENFIRVYAPSDIATECVTRQRHTGWCPSSIASATRILATQFMINGVVLINIPYTVFEGLVIDGGGDHGGNHNNAIGCIGNPEKVKIIGCIIKNCADGIYNLTTSSVIMANNVIYECTNNAIVTGGFDIVYNNTMTKIDLTCLMNQYSDIVVNNIATVPLMGGVYVCYNDNSNLKNCLSEDGSAGTINDCQPNITINFTDPDNEDFHLKDGADSEAKGTGLQLASDSYYPFNVDAQNIQRRKRWDLGALEFETKKVYFAVGSSTNDFKTMPSSGTLDFNITLTEGTRPEEIHSVIEFGNEDGLIDQINSGLGVGNEIVSQDIPDGCLLKEKIDYSHWIVTDYHGDNIAACTGNVDQIKRPFNDLATALANVWFNYLTSKDLITQKVQLNIACYNDAAGFASDPGLANTAYISSDNNYYLKIYTPVDTQKEVNLPQRHDGYFGWIGETFHSGFYIDTAGEYGLNLWATDYVEVEGLSVMAQNGIASHGIQISNSKSFAIIGNIVKSCTGDGIRTQGSRMNARDFIINNLVYNCGGDGIRTGSFVPATNSKTYIYNNTVYNCKRGIHFCNVTEGDSIIGIAVNNICQKSKYQDYVDEYSGISGFFSVDNCISKDESVKFYDGDLSYKNTTIKFSNLSSENFNLDKTDYTAVDTAIDLSQVSPYNFIDDIALKPREPGYWDRGAFEIIEIIGSGELGMAPILMERYGASAGGAIPTLVLHLREHLLAGVDPDYQFTSISALNTFLDNNDYYDSYNLEINVESNIAFSGIFSLRNRGTTREVIIQTYAEELKNGPASLKYRNGPFVDDASVEKKIVCKNLKIYSDPESTTPNDYLLGVAALTRQIDFINCIVQVNKDAVVNTAPSCVINTINSIIVYANGDISNILVLSKENAGNFIGNSTILTYTHLDAITFNTTTANSTDMVKNTLTYNYYSHGNITFEISNVRKYNCKENINPLFRTLSISLPFDIEEVMSDSFKPSNDSPLIDSGDNASLEYLPYVIETDIIGNERIYNFGVVDIGPYELQLHILSFKAQNISSIFQAKLFLDEESDPKKYISPDLKIVFIDLYDQFYDNPDYREEFVRESKIIIMLKPMKSDYIIKTDKQNLLVKEFEAYYDATLESIIITKGNDLLGNLFNNIFTDNRYVFEFNEITHKFIVYFYDTYDKGVSGDKNPVKNVQFGGTSLILN